MANETKDTKLLPFTEYDHAVMQAEGWAVFESSVRGNEIQRDDEAGVFATDEDALEHVLHRALAGSHVHTRALVEHCLGRERHLAALIRAVIDNDRNTLVLRTVVAFSDPTTHTFQNGLTGPQYEALRDLNTDRIDNGDARDACDYVLDGKNALVLKSALAS